MKNPNKVNLIDLVITTFYLFNVSFIKATIKIIMIKWQILTEEDSYDASSELSTSSSEDELNYSNRFYTNPFLKLGSSAYFAR